MEEKDDVLDDELEEGSDVNAWDEGEEEESEEGFD